MSRDQHGNETPKGFILVEALRPDGAVAQFFEPVAKGGALAEPRSKVEGDADLIALAEALGVSGAEATRRAVRLALIALEEKNDGK